MTIFLFKYFLFFRFYFVISPEKDNKYKENNPTISGNNCLDSVVKSEPECIDEFNKKKYVILFDDIEGIKKKYNFFRCNEN